jgi:hypothetical protein
MTDNTKLKEDIAVAKNDIATIKADIAEIKTILKGQDNTFVTRAELKITQWVFGAVVGALALWLNLSDHIK